MNTDISIKETKVNENNQKRKGMTLIETILVLGIVALVIGGIMIYLSQATSSNKTNDYIREISTLVDSVHQLYQGQSSYDGLSETIVAQSGLLPSKYVKGSTGGTGTGSGIISPFGGTVTLTSQGGPGAGSSGVTNYFGIDMGQIPQAACTRVSAVDFGDGLLSRTGNSANGSPLAPAVINSTCPTSGADLSFSFQ